MLFLTYTGLKQLKISELCSLWESFAEVISARSGVLVSSSIFPTVSAIHTSRWRLWYAITYKCLSVTYGTYEANTALIYSNANINMSDWEWD